MTQQTAKSPGPGPQPSDTALKTLATESIRGAAAARKPPAVGYIDAISLRELATARVPRNEIMLVVVAIVSRLSTTLKLVGDELVIEQARSSTICKRSCNHTGNCLPGGHETKAE